MAEHRFKVGLVIGRFQPIHKGHEMMIETALDHCDRVIVAIGSSQLNGTPNNPLSWVDRYTLIKNRFKEEEKSERLLLLPIPDRERYSNDASFGQYVYKIIDNAYGLTPDCIIEGKENVRTDWWKDVPHKGHIEVDREGMDVSGTKLREAIRDCNHEYVNRYQSPEAQQFNYNIWRIMKHYDENN
jgi:cytidyltransferase-like protein